MPLMVGGQVAGSQACCCENPPPPVCYCPSFCSYFIEVVEPGLLAVRHAAVGCDAETINQNASVGPISSWIVGEAMPPSELPASTADESPTSSSGVSNISASGFMNASVASGVRYGPNANPVGLVSCDVLVLVSCGSLFVGGNPFVPVVEVFVNARAYSLDNDESGFPDLGGYYHISRYLISQPPVDCISGLGTDRVCGTGRLNGYNFMQTPLTIEATGNTCSLGSYTTGEVGAGPAASLLKAWCEEMLDNLSATFRITSRDNCLPPEDCSCSYNLSGLQLQFQGEVFTVGNEPNDIRGRDSQRWVYTDSTTSPNIAFEVFNESFTETYFLASATISCSPSADPETVADKWLLTVSATCNTWDDDGNGGREIVEQTTKTWVGEYECYEHCGDFTPSGSPIQMVLVSTVTTPGLGACDPGSSPPTISVVGKAPCE